MENERTENMTQNDLIDFIVFHIDCNDCPMYARCRVDKPLTCRDYITNMFQACDAVTERAVKDLVERIRRAKTKMLLSKDPAERRTINTELSELRRQLREVKEYIND